VALCGMNATVVYRPWQILE